MYSNPFKFAEAIEQAIKDRRCGVSKTFHIGLDGDEIVCWQKWHGVKEPSPILGTFSEADLVKGLTNTQWGRIFIKIGNWLQEK